MSSVVFVLGPSGVGKTKHAFLWATRMNGIIVNADSVQVFKSVDIGTAKPPLKMRDEIPHHLFDFVKEGESYTAGEYSRDARNILQKNQDKNIFFVGGSGFYFQCLEWGMPEIPLVDPSFLSKMKKKVQKKEDLKKIFDEVAKKDPEYAGTIHPHDTYRVLKAFYFLKVLKEPLSDVYRKKPQKKKIKALKIGIFQSKKDLKENVIQRVDDMLEKGLLEEVRSLKEKGLENWAPLKSIGYKESLKHLKGDISLNELREEIIKNTMLLIKKQFTWFKRDEEIKWFLQPVDDNEVMEYLEKHIQIKDQR